LPREEVPQVGLGGTIELRREQEDHSVAIGHTDDVSRFSGRGELSEWVLA
jgi:hypothetical protein